MMRTCVLFIISLISLFLMTPILAAPVGAIVANRAAIAGAVRQTSAKVQVSATERNAPDTTATSALPTEIRRTHSAFYAGFGISMPNVRGYTGLMPKIFGGYGAYLGACKNFYMGLEAFGGAYSLPLSSNQIHRVYNYYGAALVPGYALQTGTLLYAKLGGNRAKYKDSKQHGGALVGIGVQPVLNERWDMRFEYTFTVNGSLNQYNLDFVYHFC